MTKKLILFSIALVTLFSCNQSADINKNEEKESGTAKENNTVEITPFVINEVILNDTTKVVANTSGFTKDGKWFPTETSFGYNSTYSPMSFDKVKNLILSLRKNHTLKIYLNMDSSALSSGEAYMYLKGCDSIVDIDDNGKPIGPPIVVCDSTSMYYKIKKILFYESWSLNENNGSIEKTVLGYTFLSYIEDKNQYNLMYHVFPDDASLAKAKKYLSRQIKDVSKKQP